MRCDVRCDVGVDVDDTKHGESYGGGGSGHGRVCAWCEAEEEDEACKLQKQVVGMRPQDVRLSTRGTKGTKFETWRGRRRGIVIHWLDMRWCNKVSIAKRKIQV